MKQFLLASLLFVTGLTASAQGDFSAQANALKQQYLKNKAMTRADGKEMPKASFVVICKAEASPVAVAEQLKTLGAEVNSVYGRCVAVTIPADKIEAMAQTEGVLLVDVATKGVKKTDTSRKVTQVDEVQSGKGEKLPQAYTGKDVVIGVMDTGFDYTHPGFKDKDGNLRVKAVYLAGNTKVPQEKVTVTKTDHTGASTQVQLLPGIVTDPKVILDTLKVKDGTESHGTHCAYIAAGTPVEGVNGLTGNTLGGMAPDAELILCTDQPDKDSDGEAIVNVSNSTSDFLDYMKHYAEKNNKELVVSYSMNAHDGWHNGTSPTSQLLGEFAKNNVLMLCASNEGEDSIYIHRTVNVGDSINVAVSGNQSSIYFFVKSVKPIEARMGIYDLSDDKEVYACPLTINTGRQANDTVQIFSFINDQIKAELSKHTPEERQAFEDVVKNVSNYFTGGIEFASSQGTAMESNTSDNTFKYTLITVKTATAQFKSFLGMPVYGWTLHVKPLEEPAEVFAWADNNATMINEGIFIKGTSEVSMGDWNTTGLPVSVGAWSANNVNKKLDGTTKENRFGKVIGGIAEFSSFGTDLAGHKHPDVCTPGVSVYSAINSFYEDPNEDYTVVAKKDLDHQFEGQKSARTYQWGSSSGTSMSTPASAGIVALWMQAARDKGRKLTSADIKDICAKTSDNDDFTKAKPERFGFGKMNAYKGLLYVLGLYDPSGINGISTNQPDNITFRVAGDCLYADGAEDGTPVTLYNLQGIVVAQTQVQGGMISLAGLHKGVYAVQLAKLGSTLIRK